MLIGKDPVNPYLDVQFCKRLYIVNVTVNDIETDEISRNTGAGITIYIENEVEISKSFTDRLIDKKNRWTYNTSCDFLLLKKENMIRNNQYPEWKKYIKQLRREKKRFRALIDELDKADVN